MRRMRAAIGRLGSVLTLGRRSALPYSYFTIGEVASMHLGLAPKDESLVDDGTWRDLQLDTYMRQLTEAISIVGRQMIYHRLRSGQRPECDPVLAAHDGEAPTVEHACEPGRQLLRTLDSGLSTALFHNHGINLPVWSGYVWLISVIGFAGSVAALTKTWPLAIGLLSVYAVLAISASSRLSPQLRRWQEIRSSLVAVIEVGLDWASVGERTNAKLLKPLIAARNELRLEAGRFRLSILEQVPAFTEYGNLLLLYDYARLRRRVEMIDTRRAALQKLYALVSDAEANICVANHLYRGVKHCRVTPSVDRSLHWRGIVNPLLPDATPLTLTVRRGGIFLTGRNGSGKSTLLRGIGINLVVARAYGFCYAEAACVPRVTVISSIVNEDSLERAESLYMAELRRMEIVTAIAQARDDVVVLVDEIFRGTNPTESVAVATAVLWHLAARATVLASSHHVIMAPLLQGRLQALRFVEASMSAAPRLEEGVLAQTNGIEMMARYCYGSEVLETARNLATWLIDYQIHPAHCPQL